MFDPETPAPSNTRVILGTKPTILRIMNIAFIGLGNMGSAMARNLLRAGHELTVYNRTREKAAAMGVRVAASPAEACRDCEAVVTMLADDHAVEEVFFGSAGLLSGFKAETIHISSSTIRTGLARRLPLAPTPASHS